MYKLLGILLLLLAACHLTYAQVRIHTKTYQASYDDGCTGYECKLEVPFIITDNESTLINQLNDSIARIAVEIISMLTDTDQLFETKMDPEVCNDLSSHISEYEIAFEVIRNDERALCLKLDNRFIAGGAGSGSNTSQYLFNINLQAQTHITLSRLVGANRLDKLQEVVIKHFDQQQNRPFSEYEADNIRLAGFSLGKDALVLVHRCYAGHGGYWIFETSIPYQTLSGLLDEKYHWLLTEN